MLSTAIRWTLKLLISNCQAQHNKSTTPSLLALLNIKTTRMATRYQYLAALSVMAAMAFLASNAVTAQTEGDTDMPCNSTLMPCGEVIVPEYIAPPMANRRASSRKLAGSRSLLSTGPILTIYEDAYRPEANGTRHGLDSINKVFGQDYFVQPVSALANLNYAETQIAWISSALADCERDNILPTVQSQLREFVNAGGVAVLDLGNFCGSFSVAPRPDGTQLTTIFDDNAFNGYGPAALPENQAATPLVTNPTSLIGITPLRDGLPFILSQGFIPRVELPTGATVHLLDSDSRVIMTTYKIGAGTVLVDTIVKEYDTCFAENNVVRNLLQFAYDEANANMGCTADDYLCNNCKDRAAQNPAALSSVGSCYNCALNLANSWQCYQCMSSSTNPDVVSGCLKCIADGVPSWSCPQWCASAATTGQQMSSCETCLTTPGINTWGCFNCLSMANGDVNMSNQCNQCLYDGRDPWSCGQCLLKSDSTAVDTCFKCLPPIGGDTWPCLSA